jgi:tripartite-type tricarboxylate transporter receptor subunit TctC
MVSAGHTINPAMIKKLPYDSVKDFTPVGIIADVPTAFVMHPSLPPKNLKEFIAIAKARPNDIFYSTAGRGYRRPSFRRAADLDQDQDHRGPLQGQPARR